MGPAPRRARPLERAPSRALLTRAVLTRLLGTCAVSVALPVAARAEESGVVDLAEEADLHFSRGVAAYRRADFETALSHLLQSNRLVPNRNVAFNIARCYEQLGQFEAAFRHYHDVWEQEPDPNEKANARAALDRIGPRVALVEVITDPPGARVYLDRTDLGARGLAPRTLALKSGRHVVIAELEGHESAQSDPVTLEAGKPVSVRLKLNRILGQVKLGGSPAGATVKLSESGPVLGTVPGTLDLPPGQHVLVVEAPGHRTARLPVTVQARETTPSGIDLSLLTGTVVVDADESEALIEIDGQAQGFTPSVLRDVPVGRHKVRIKRAGFQTYETEIEVAVDAEARVSAELRAANEVVGASRTAQSVDDAPASVSLVSHQEIRAFAYETVYDAMQGVRGVFPSDDRTYTALGIRGFARAGDYGNRVLVTMDGHTMNDDQLGSGYVGRDFATDLNDVRRIELVRGPGSALYGTNAFFGVVNVVTADGENLDRPHVQVAHGASGLVRARVGGGQKINEKAGFWLSAGAARSQGEDLTLRDPDGGASQRVVGADGLESASLAGKAWWGDLTLQAYYNVRDKRIPTGAYETILGDPRARSEDRRAFIEGRFEPKIGDPRLTIRAWLDHYAFKGVYPYDDAEVGVLTDTWSGIWAGSEVRVAGAVANNKLRYTLGAEARSHLSASLQSEDASGRFLDASPGFQVFSGYALIDWRLASAVTLNGGARFDHFSNVGNTFSPRLAAIFKPATADVVKVIAGRSFRAPSPYELQYNDGGITQLAADGLNPESVLTGEVEYSHRFGADVQVLVGGFYNRISDLIDLAPIAGDAEERLQYTNVNEDLHTLGAEVELRREWRQGWFFSGAYAFQRTRVGSLGSDNRLTNSPVHLASVKVAAPIGRTGATLANRLRAEGPRFTRAGDETDTAFLWDLTVTGDIPGGVLDYAIGVRNLLDWKHEQATGEDLGPTRVPQPGRSFYASLRGSY